MEVRNCLILSAGYGTRMGEAGKIVPKILWPVFEKKLIFLQIAYAKSLGCKKIYINTHFLHEKIATYIAELNDNSITLLHESVLLDVGGGILNVAAQPEMKGEEHLLVLNGDQFFFFDTSFFERALSLLLKSRAVLFSSRVGSGEKYNETVLENGRLVEIRTGGIHDSSYLTYSGVGLINLQGLGKLAGPAKFFSSVADYKKESVLMLEPTGCEYWDFGTSEKYFSSMFRLLETTSGPFFDFCRNHGVFDFSKLSTTQKSYNSLAYQWIINLTGVMIKNETKEKIIVFNEKVPPKIQGSGIYCENLFVKCS